MKLIIAPAVGDLIAALEKIDKAEEWGSNKDGCIYIGHYRDSYPSRPVLCISPNGHTDWPEYLDES